ncbi:cell wall-binding repeat-containing protein [Mesobacillus subterraneus]|uniref:cell wall-binding repeat-containing protein n=1 Tax=Mesobacillus subterraneus TaxID=285983 RepID=UPI00273F4393|nr:cell wall-binding repeat-containing protein [Mesobacillus subterraneus]WLR55511.1 cell wall-binding repeat-containing protein [Mesobacillus subterraneus]
MGRWAKFVFLLSVVFFLGSMPVNAEETKRIVVKYKTEQAIKGLSLKKKAEDQSRKTKILTVSKTETQKVMNALKKDPYVVYAEEEKEYQYYSPPVNDAYFATYQLKDFNAIKAAEAWRSFIPKARPVVAVLDSGIDMSHPDLKNMIYKPYNILNGSSLPFDDVGHGTHVVGIIGAETNNKIGVASLSKGSYIMPIKIGTKNGISNIDLADGIYHAVKNGASIINISVGGEYSEYVEESCNYAYQKGVLVIAAAGNDGVPYESYPAAHNSVMAIAASDSRTNTLADFSNYGDWISVAAPGVNIYSTYLSGKYATMDGTSMVSPMAASLAALIKNHHPGLTNNQLRWIMEASSEEYEGSLYHSNGRMNAQNSLTLFKDYSRAYGATSVETSNTISMTGWETALPGVLMPEELELNPDLPAREGRFVIMASNQSFPDSLAAGALSYKLDAPLLLTYPNSLRQSTIDTLGELQADQVLIMGGPGAVSDSVKSNLEQLGFEVHRLMGDDRFETAAAINDYIAKRSGKVIVTNARDFPDALSVSAFAGSEQIPIVFVERNSIPEATKEFLNKYKFSKAIVIGGPGVVSDQVLKQLPNGERIGGADRFDTNRKVINYFKPTSDFNGVILATGRNFPDALSGAPVSAKLDYPLVLVDPAKGPAATFDFVKQKTAYSNMPDMITLGGPAVIPPAIVWRFDQILYNSWYNEEYGPYLQFSKHVDKPFSYNKK